MTEVTVTARRWPRGWERWLDEHRVARRSREAARQPRAAGYSVTDAAVITGISRGRVSQLANG